jgi:hypothetical protein
VEPLTPDEIDATVSPEARTATLPRRRPAPEAASRQGRGAAAGVLRASGPLVMRSSSWSQAHVSLTVKYEDSMRVNDRPRVRVERAEGLQRSNLACFPHATPHRPSPLLLRPWPTRAAIGRHQPGVRFSCVQVPGAASQRITRKIAGSSLAAA